MNSFLQLLQETAEREEIERLKQLLHDYEKKNREALETANKQVASQAELTEEIRKLKQQSETERTEFDNLIQERDTYKKKVEELQMQPAAEQGKVLWISGHILCKGLFFWRE